MKWLKSKTVLLACHITRCPHEPSCRRWGQCEALLARRKFKRIHYHDNCHLSMFCPKSQETQERATLADCHLTSKAGKGQAMWWAMMLFGVLTSRTDIQETKATSTAWNVGRENKLESDWPHASHVPNILLCCRGEARNSRAWPYQVEAVSTGHRWSSRPLSQLWPHCGAVNPVFCEDKA